MANIDWNFIGDLEGERLIGYVPNAEGSKSGVTIATGFDLGARNESDIKDLPIELQNKLKPYLGLKGDAAKALASKLRINSDEAKIINDFSKKNATTGLAKKWYDKTGKDFFEMSQAKQTVVASVAFQYGDLASETPNFWKQTTTGDWDGALKNLRNFGDDYKTRRNKEASYLEKSMLQDKIIDTGGGALKSIKEDLEASQLVEGATGTIVDSKKKVETVEEEDESILPPPPPIGDDVALDDMPVFQFPEYKTNSQKKPKFESDNFYINRMSIAEESEKAQFQAINTLTKSRESAVPEQQLIDNLLEEDIALSGPVSETIKKNELGVAGPALFTSTKSEIWRAAFQNYNPILAFSEYLNNLTNQYPEDPDYDEFADPQLKGYDGSMWRFIGSPNEHETAKRIKKLEEESYNSMVLGASDSGFETFVSALATPSSVLPLAPLKALRSTSFGTRALASGATTGSALSLEQGFMLTQKQTYEAEQALMAVAIGSVFSGAIGGVFGRSISKGADARFVARDKKFEESFGEGGFYRSAGASVNPDIARKQAYSTIEQDALKETGIGVEKLPINPMFRLLQSSNPIVRGLVAEMVSLGGMMQKKIDSEEAVSQSVERNFTTKYISSLVESLREVDTAYLSYRGVVAKEGDIGRSFQVFGQQIKDKFSRNNSYLSEYDFRIRVSKAMRRGDVDELGDAASPYVSQAAQSARRNFNLIKNEATGVRLFEIQIRKALRAARESGDEVRIRELTARLDRVRSEGVFTNTAISYLPRLYRVDKIMANQDSFKAILRQYAINELGLVDSQLDDYVTGVFDSIVKNKPYMAIDEFEGQLEDVIVGSAFRMRELEINDELIEEFLENDIEVLLRHHTKQMGVDIELQRAFGSVDMKPVIDKVSSEWRRLIDETQDPALKAKYEKELLSDLKDIRGLRDRLRGTYGASKDPHQMSSRFVRTMKSINVLIGMGGATISSIPDMARPVMVEGFKNVYEKGLRASFRENASRLKALSKKELKQSAIAADAVLGLRAHAFADLGDVFGNRFAVERGLNQSVGIMFVLNGLNIWNQALKEFAGNVTLLRMTESIMKPWGSLSKADKEKFLKTGIDQAMSNRIRVLINKHGEQVDGEWLPNTELWQDIGARDAFRNSLNESVERTIITPGAGDRALWTSTEFGSLLTQFKSYGQAATVRLLTSGLQEKDGAFWQGAFLLVGLAAMVNEIKRNQYGITNKESFDEKLINAVDRSGVLGSFMDVNNAVEKLSNYGLGLRPMVNDKKQYPLPVGAKVSAVFGPTAGNLVNVSGIAGDVLGGRADQKTLDSLSFSTPFRTHPLADPLFDRLYNQ